MPVLRRQRRATPSNYCIARRSHDTPSWVSRDQFKIAQDEDQRVGTFQANPGQVAHQRAINPRHGSVKPRAAFD